MIFVFVVIGIALVSDFINGCHDAANSIATAVSTRVLKPQIAVLWAAFFNLIAIGFFGLHVAGTIGQEIVKPETVDTVMIFSALVSTIVWNLFTWYLGIPSSSSHALMGGLIGAVSSYAGLGALIPSGLFKIGIAIFAAPIFGFILSYVLMNLMILIFRKVPLAKGDKIARFLQLVSAALYSLGHGGNDAQKTMGIIAILLFSKGLLGEHFFVPSWVVIACQGVMALGTLLGGWRIVRTMGMKITKLKPLGGFCAETAGALTLFSATFLGIPVSTTHTIIGSIIGVGSMQSLNSVRWKVALRVVSAWFSTLPATIVLSGIVQWLTRSIYESFF